MRVIGIPVRDEAQGTFVVESLKSAVEAQRLTLEDIAFASKEADGTVKIHQTKDAGAGKGAVRGGLVGALIGLAAPPFLAVAAVGAGVGALVSHFRDTGVDDKLMKTLGDELEPGQGIVFALGSDEAIKALEEKVRELTDGQIATFTLSLDEDHDAALRSAAGG